MNKLLTPDEFVRHVLEVTKMVEEKTGLPSGTLIKEWIKASPMWAFPVCDEYRNSMESDTCANCGNTLMEHDL